MATGKRLLAKIVIDVLSLIIVFIPTLVFEFGHIRPFQRGFFCDDDSIKYPYKSNTVPWWAVGVFGLLVPAITIIVVEFIHERYPRRPLAEKLPPYQLTATRSIPRFVVYCYKLIGALLFGAAVNQPITDICKYSIGRLRPHFLDVCRPNISAGVCDGHVPGTYVYVDNFTCTLPEDDKQLDSRLSFLSGHTSVSVYCAVFFVFYVQARFTWSGSKLLRHLLQAIAIYLAVYTGLSRISDYKHHWSDVLAGAVLGTFVASLTCHHISYMFRQSSYLPTGDKNVHGSKDVVMLSVEGVETTDNHPSTAATAGSVNYRL